MLVGVLFFCLETKEKIPKEKLKAALPGLLRKYFQLKGRNSLRSNSLPFFTLKILPTLDAPTVRPGDHAAYGERELIVFSDGVEVNTDF